MNRIKVIKLPFNFKIEKILRKKQTGFWRNRSTSQILTIPRILEGVIAKKKKKKKIEATILFVDFSKAFDFKYRGKMQQILLANGLSKETLAVIMMLYKNTKVKVRSPNGDRLLRYWSIVAGVLKGVHQPHTCLSSAESTCLEGLLV